MDKENNNKPQPKKRGRKPKVVAPEVTDENVKITTETASEEPVEKPPPKKRGRKPKGGKIVVPVEAPVDVADTKVNVILHLKCFLKDLQGDAIGSMEPYNATATSMFDTMNNTNNYVISDCAATNASASSINECVNDLPDDEYADTESKTIWKKIKQLEHQLHHNYSNDTKSACFWCTFAFDNPPIYIPKFFLKETYHVYGCFCSPECATAHLMEENIDSSTKFERYYLLNNIYGGVYNYSKNIKPAPNPYYMLDKYYGNLSIQEYRSLLSNERLFLIVDKPLTRIMPDLHQANEDHIITNKIIPANQNTRQPMKKPQKKTDILAENFGFGAS